MSSRGSRYCLPFLEICSRSVWVRLAISIGNSDWYLRVAKGKRLLNSRCILARLFPELCPGSVISGWWSSNLCGKFTKCESVGVHGRIYELGPKSREKRTQNESEGSALSLVHYTNIKKQNGGHSVWKIYRHQPYYYKLHSEPRVAQFRRFAWLG